MERLPAGTAEDKNKLEVVFMCSLMRHGQYSS